MASSFASSLKPFWFVVAVFVGLSAIALISRTLGGKELVPWQSDFAAAREESSKTGKPVLLYFTASWCGPCQQMKRTTFADPDVEAALEKYVTLKIDVDRESDLARQFGADAIPAFYLLDKNGTATRSTAGYMSSEEFLRWLKS